MLCTTLSEVSTCHSDQKKKQQQNDKHFFSLIHKAELHCRHNPHCSLLPYKASVVLTQTSVLTWVLAVGGCFTHINVVPWCSEDLFFLFAVLSHWLANLPRVKFMFYDWSVVFGVVKVSMCTHLYKFTSHNSYTAALISRNRTWRFAECAQTRTVM